MSRKVTSSEPASEKPTSGEDNKKRKGTTDDDDKPASSELRFAYVVVYDIRNGDDNEGSDNTEVIGIFHNLEKSLQAVKEYTMENWGWDEDEEYAGDYFVREEEGQEGYECETVQIMKLAKFQNPPKLVVEF
jgi:hypothetical protein